MKTFVVLGMHRSATSLMAKGLSMAGVHMGDRLLGADPTNPYGHFEDLEFIEMNEQILESAGGSWNNPPPEENIAEVGVMLRDNIWELIEKRNNEHRLWGWKDPRTTLTIKAYLPMLTSPHFFTCFRGPREVAASLKKRDGMQFEKGVQLAMEYNRRLFAFLDDWSRPWKKY